MSKLERKLQRRWRDWRTTRRRRHARKGQRPAMMFGRPWGGPMIVGLSQSPRMRRLLR